MLKSLHRCLVAILIFLSIAAFAGWLYGAFISNSTNRPYSSNAMEILKIGDDNESIMVGIDRYSVVFIHTRAISRSLNQLALPKATLHPKTGFVYFEMPTWSDNSPTQACRVVSVEYWLLAAVCALYPVIFFIHRYRRRRFRRKALHPCEECGYDLQGNESGVCPECGTYKEDTA